MKTIIEYENNNSQNAETKLVKRVINGLEINEKQNCVKTPSI